MSKALKCDRCKKCFDIEDEKSGPRVHIPVMTLTDAERAGAGSFIDRAEDVDFCPACAEEFMTWINRKNTVKQTGEGDPLSMEDILDEQLGGAIRRAGYGDPT